MSISFNGSSSKLVWSGAIVAGYPYSMFCWIKPASATVSQMAIGSAGTTNGNEDTIFADGETTGKIRAYSRINSGNFSANSTTSQTTTWQPALAVFTNANSRKIYYSSGAVVTDTNSCATFASAHQRVAVGTRARTDSLWFNGDIAEVAFWSSSLTQTDFDALAAGTRPDGVSPGTLVEHWTLKAQSASQTGKNGRVLTASNTSQGSTHPISAAISSAGAIASTTAFGTPTVTSTYPYAISTAKADGAWTWFNQPEAVCYNGATYFGTVDSDGIVWVSKFDHSRKTTTNFQLFDTALVNDHQNASILIRPDGRIVAFYGYTVDLTIRWRVSTNPEDISAFGAEQSHVDTRGNTYPSPIYLSGSSKAYRFGRRRVDEIGETREINYRIISDDWTSVGSFVSVYRHTTYYPYFRIVDDGVDTIHFATTDMHPVEGQSSLYHFYMRLDGSNVLKCYETDGTEITASLPFGPSDATLVYSGATTKCWVSHVAIEPGTGYPRILYMKYPGNDGSAIEYWHARWNGSAWSSVKITDDGAGLYNAELYYHGGLCFDGADPDTIWLSAPVSGTRQIQMWQTADNGATWAKARSITSGATTNKRLRPISPRNHDGSLPVLWFDGTYTAFDNYSGEIKGFFTTLIELAGAAVSTATAGGTLTTGIPLSGSAASVSVASGVLTAQIRLSGDALAQVLASATLASNAAQLAGSGASSASATGQITTQIQLSGAALMQVLASADITTNPAGLAGNAVATATATGQLSTGNMLVAEASCIAIAAGGLTTSIRMTGSAVSVAAATGDLTVINGFGGLALAEVSATGTLSTQIQLDASAVMQAIAAASLMSGAPQTTAWYDEIDAFYGDFSVECSANGTLFSGIIDTTDADQFGTLSMSTHRLRYPSSDGNVTVQGIVTVSGMEYKVIEIPRRISRSEMVAELVKQP